MGQEVDKTVEEKLFERYYTHLLGGEILHSALFGSLPTLLRQHLKEENIPDFLANNSKQAIIYVLGKETTLKRHVKGLQTFKEKMMFCYDLYRDLGYCFRHEIVEENDEKLVVKVYACPHWEFTKKDPLACFSCMGIKMGIYKGLFGEDLRIDYFKRLALGDFYCLFNFYKPK